MSKQGRADSMKNNYLITFFAKGFAVSGQFIIVTVIAWLYGLSEVGSITEFIAWILGFTMLIVHGLNVVITKNIARQDLGKDEKIVIFSYCNKRVFCAFVVFSLLTIFFGYFYWGVEKSILLVGCVFSSVYSYLASGLLKGEGDAVRSVLIENGLVALFASFIILFFYLVMPEGDVIRLYLPYLLSSLAVAIYAAISISKYAYSPFMKSWKIKIEKRLRKEISHSSKWIFLGGVSTFLQLSVFVLVASLWMSDIDLGVYKIVTQIGIAIGFPMLVANSVFAKPLVTAFITGREKAKKECVNAANLTFISGLIIYMFLWLPWDRLPLDLIWFDREILDIARFVGLAQLVNVATGPVFVALNMFGYEREGAISIVCASIFSLLAFIVLTNIYALSGALFAYALLLISQNILAVLLLYNKTGIWMLPLQFSHSK